MVEDTQLQAPAAVVVPHGIGAKNKPPLPHPDTDVLTSHPAQPTKRLTGDPDPTHTPRDILDNVDRATQEETVQDALPRTVRLILFAHAITVLVNVHMKSSEMSIGELATRFGLAPHVLRHWESMGLLTPGRVPGGQRRYGDADLARVAMILMGKEAGLGLRELRNLLSTSNPMDHSELLRHHVAVLDRRITQAQAAKELIEHALSCPTNFAECPHAHERIEARIPPP
jgi:DNA-binding transcriptional MerR regulator